MTQHSGLLDITEFMLQYRECVRNIWNAYFRTNFKKNNSLRLVDFFSEVKTSLLNGIVINTIFGEYYDTSEFFPVVHLSFPVSAQINREQNKDFGYWDHKVIKLEPSDELIFKDFFDWNNYGCIDMTHIMVNIKTSHDKSIENHFALIESRDVRFLISTPQTTA